MGLVFALSGPSRSSPTCRPARSPAIAQRYHRPQGRDQKIYSIGGRLFGVEKIFPARTEEEKHGEPFTPSRELCEIALRCGRAFGIDLYGVDISRANGSRNVVEICSIPGFKSVPNAPARGEQPTSGAAAQLGVTLS